MNASESHQMPIHFVIVNEAGTEAATRMRLEEPRTDVPDGAALDAGPFAADDPGTRDFEKDLAASRAGGTGYTFMETGTSACYVAVVGDADGD